jgi:hypothetical protein
MASLVRDKDRSDARVLIVTGGSRGIGAATSRLAASRGFAVCVNYLQHETRGGERWWLRFERDGGTAVAVQADVSSESDVLRLFETVDRRLGRPSALVNNAATLETQMRLDAMDSARDCRGFSEPTSSEASFVRGKRFDECPLATGAPEATSSTFPPVRRAPVLPANTSTMRRPRGRSKVSPSGSPGKSPKRESASTPCARDLSTPICTPREGSQGRVDRVKDVGSDEAGRASGGSRAGDSVAAVRRRRLTLPARSSRFQAGEAASKTWSQSGAGPSYDGKLGANIKRGSLGPQFAADPTLRHRNELLRKIPAPDRQPRSAISQLRGILNFDLPAFAGQ